MKDSKSSVFQLEEKQYGEETSIKNLKLELIYENCILFVLPLSLKNFKTAFLNRSRTKTLPRDITQARTFPHEKNLWIAFRRRNNETRIRLLIALVLMDTNNTSVSAAKRLKFILAVQIRK